MTHTFARKMAYSSAVIIALIYLPFFFLATSYREGDPGGQMLVFVTIAGIFYPQLLLYPISHIMLWSGMIMLVRRSWTWAALLGISALGVSFLFVLVRNFPAQNRQGDKDLLEFVGPAEIFKFTSMAILGWIGLMGWIFERRLNARCKASAGRSNKLDEHEISTASTNVKVGEPPAGLISPDEAAGTVWRGLGSSNSVRVLFMVVVGFIPFVVVLLLFAFSLGATNKMHQPTKIDTTDKKKL